MGTDGLGTAVTAATQTRDCDHVVDRVCEIERLAALEPIDYEVERSAAASRLNLRTKILDGEVKAKRRALGLDSGTDDGQGRAVKIVDVLPWHEPVEGDFIATGIDCGQTVHGIEGRRGGCHRAVGPAHLARQRVHRVSPTGGHVTDQGLWQDNGAALPQQGGASPQEGRKHLAAGPVPRDRDVSADNHPR